MKLTILETGNFMLDGGAIFGVVPKSLWSKQYPADENNLCNMSLRSLLIEDGERLILVDTGIGNKQDEKFFGYYFLNGASSLMKSLSAAGYQPGDITDVLLTHLHFDHAGGAVVRDAQGDLSPTFPKALYHVSRKQWEWALQPNAREKASYLKENIFPLEASGNLRWMDEGNRWKGSVEVRFYHGHTDGLMIPFIHTPNKTYVFTADLLPFQAHIPLSWVCGYDTRPLVSMKEKEQFLKEASEKGYYLIFQHDLYHPVCTVSATDKGIRVKESLLPEQAGIAAIA